MSHMHTYVTYMYARAMCVQVRDQGMYVFYSVPFSVHTIYGHIYNIVCATLPVVCRLDVYISIFKLLSLWEICIFPSQNIKLLRLL